jgi:PAS domain S-box-containing protein
MLGFTEGPLLEGGPGATDVNDEHFFDELKRYVRFDERDGEALRAFWPHASPHFRTIADEFYGRVVEHDKAKRVFSGPEQVERLKITLCAWMDLLLKGPWDEVYYELRARIGRRHVMIGLPQRYMFSAMTLIRTALKRIAHESITDGNLAIRVDLALAKIIDIELAIMLETYREAHVEMVQQTEREQALGLKTQLAVTEARYAEIVDKAWSLISILAEDASVQLFNVRCEEVTGVTRDRALGRSWLELFVMPEEREAVNALWEKVRSGLRVAPWEGRVPGSLTVDRRVRWHFTTLPADGQTPLLCAIGIDVTEERELAVRTRRAERLAALGTMAAGLAHEIRNPLNAAALQLAVVQRRLARAEKPDVDGALRAAELVASEMTRLAGLVDEFLQFARPRALRLAAADLRVTASEIVQLLAPDAATAGVELKLADGHALFARVDEERLKQVLHNLIRNAIEATGRGGHVELRVRQGGEGALLEVEDDGPGLPSPDAPIFEPFFTTKSGGTGLGLAIAHRIVTDHGGKIVVESRPGRTVFALHLPIGS